MISYRLWDALNHPPTHHPLFWRMIRSDTLVYFPASHMALLDKLSVIYLIAFVGALLLTNVLSWAAQSALLALLLVLLALPIILPVVLLLRLTLFSGSFYGIAWTARISQQISRQQQTGAYDLLALLPSGELAAAWAISVGCLYRRHRFTNAQEMRSVWLRIILFAVAVMMMSALLRNAPDIAPALLLGVLACVAIVALQIDFIQSTILAVLVGMIVPTCTRTEARLWAAGGFLVLQVITYMVAILTAVVMLPGAYLLALTASLVVFCAVREALIAGLWYGLLRLSNTHPDDLECVFTGR